MKGLCRRACVVCVLLFSPLAGAETGVTDNMIILGQSAAFAGPAAELGRELREGANTYFDFINRNGGVHGRKIKLVSLDDGYEPDRALSNTQLLVDQEKAFALFGYVGTPTSYAVLPLVNQARIPFFGAFTGAARLRHPYNRYVFNIRASYDEEAEKLVDYLVSERKHKIAVFYQNDAYGFTGLNGVKKALEARKMDIVASATVERNSQDVAAAVKTITAAQPDAVILVSAYKSCAAFIEGVNAAGGIMEFANLSFVGSRALGEELGRQGHGVMVSQVVPYPWAMESSIGTKFRLMLQDYAPDSRVSFNNLEGFISAMVFVEGLQRAGRELTRDHFIAALETIKNFDVGGFYVSFSPDDHNGSHFVQVSMILGANGRYVFVGKPSGLPDPVQTRYAQRPATPAETGMIKVRYKGE